MYSFDMDILPLFKTHYSIGKSILTLQSPNSIQEGGPSSVIDLCLDAGLDKVVLVEDNLHGLLEAKKRCDENNLQLIFGFRLSLCCEYADPTDKKALKDMQFHKVIVFANNDNGVRRLYKIYSEAFCEHDGKLIVKDLKKNWSKKDLTLAIPFYDSFLYMNNFKLASRFMPDFSFADPTFFLEDNGLPFDHLLQDIVNNFTSERKLKIQKVKSIYYKNKEDFKSYQTFKIITSRSFSKRASFSAPNLDDCASDEFCMESWLNDN